MWGMFGLWSVSSSEGGIACALAIEKEFVDPEGETFQSLGPGDAIFINDTLTLQIAGAFVFTLFASAGCR